MKSKALFILISSLSLLTACNTGTSWREMGLKGKVKAIQEYYVYDEDDTFTDADRRWEMTFDEKGNCKESNLFFNNFAESKSVYTYKGNQIAEVQNYDGYNDNKLSSTMLYEDRKSKDLLEYKKHDAEGELTLKGEVNLENGLGVKLVDTFYDSKGKEKEYITTTRSYDANNNLTEMKVVKREAKSKKKEVLLHIKTEYIEYDELGNWIKSYQHILSGDVTEKKTICLRTIEYF